MAESPKLTRIELNGVLYSMGKAVYEELDISLERFAELLGRDLYCPTLQSAPTSSTLTYVDTDESVNGFQVGQACRWVENGEYRLAVCRNITPSEASWYVLPVGVSELSNDAGYLAERNLKTINGKSIVGEGDLVAVGFAFMPSFDISDNMELILTAHDEVTSNMFSYDSNTGCLTLNY